jgi:hypothetical protein
MMSHNEGLKVEKMCINSNNATKDQNDNHMHFFISRVRLPGLPGIVSILSWNCRGLGHPKAVPSLKDLVRVYKPYILFLILTLVHSNKIKDLCYVLCYDFSFAINREG